MKTCIKCEIEKDISEYHKNKLASDGLHTYCKTCRNVKEKTGSKYGRAVLSTKEYNRQRQIFHKYGLTIEQYDAMLSQPCGACGDVATTVDHDHACCPTVRTCGKCIRGVLCHRCNLLEGKLSANKDRVVAIMNYLSRYGERL